MSQYNFANLSSFDFERLARDLLQEEFQVTLEAFGAGRDGGIDLRHSRSCDGDLIVQCKHYLSSGYAAMHRHLEKTEVKKVRALRPARYVLVTSVSLSPTRKQEIVELFKPFIKTPADVFGSDDLHSLLSRHPTVERRQYKLWLTSTEVLRSVLHSDVLAKTEHLKTKLGERAKVFVQSDAYPLAQKMLEERHCCIVAGIPGIGKTTLADMLLLDHCGRGYEPVLVSGDVDDAWKSLSGSALQFFYYDDFLGQTAFAEKLGKNEDARLVEFIDYVQRAENKRFVLTTREYILNDAEARYERLSRGELDLHKFVIDLASYTKFQRAQVLYNHIYFSGMSTADRAELDDANWYLAAIDHANFNPRLIEHAVRRVQRGGQTPSELKSLLLESLENPAHLWDHAFRNQLSDEGRDALRVLSTFPVAPSMSSLRAVLGVLWSVSAEEAGERLVESLKILEGSFTSTSQKQTPSGRITSVSFHNPSVRDYMKGSLEDPLVLNRLLPNACFFEQVELPLAYALADPSGAIAAAVHKVPAAYLPTCQRLIGAPYAATGANSSIDRERRLSRYLQACRLFSQGPDLSWLTVELDALAARWRRMDGNLREAVDLLKELPANVEPHRYTEWLAATKVLLLSGVAGVREFHLAFRSFAEAFPLQVDEDTLEQAAVTLGNIVSEDAEEPSRHPKSSAELEELIADICDAADYFSTDLEREVEELKEEQQAMAAREDAEMELQMDDYRGRQPSADTSDGAIIEMFQTLKS